jgi:D-alanine transaminase
MECAGGSVRYICVPRFESEEQMSLEDSANGVVWLNGQYTDFASATVSIEDRGFVFGDGIYEVARVYNGKPFALDRHLARLRRSAAALDLEVPVEEQALEALIHDVWKRSGLPNCEIYIQVTRGVARRNHVFPEHVKPSMFIGIRAGRQVPAEAYEEGCRLITLPDERWARCDLKTICLLPNVLAKEKAHRAGAMEALLIRDGFVTEGTSCNVFMWSDGNLVTPISDNRILPGITRSVIFDIARERGYNIVERNITPDQVLGAEGVFITSTTIELLPVVKIDDTVIGNGRPGDIRGDLQAAFNSLTGKIDG